MKKTLFLISFCCLFMVTKAQVPVADSLALVALYNSTNGPSWTDNTNWLQPGHPVSEWYGITVINGLVNTIRLTGNNLVGSIPTQIGDFTKLKHLYLYENNLTGSIPSEIGDLDSLEYLLLQNNQLTGSLPPEIGNLKRLESLSLSYNQLTGPIPSEIGGLVRMEGLRLNGNNLGGNIPLEIGNLNSLNYIDISQNQLTGSIPPEIGNLVKLTHLSLDDNLLTGDIPEAVGDLIKLENLYLNRNQLTGSIPASLFNLTKLSWLFLHENQLTGTIPPEIGNLTALNRLFMSDNQFSGPIPTEIGNLTGLEYLILRENQLTGDIPTSIGNLILLQQLRLSKNQLTGTIPTGIGNLSLLKRLELDDNNLTHSIPSEIGNLSILERLNLSHNELVGVVPEEISQLGQLIILSLHDNQFVGPLPDGIKDLPYLVSFTIYNNYFTFSDLEPFIGISFDDFYYDPQLPVQVSPSQINISSGDTLDLDIANLAVSEVRATNNQYRWWKQGVDMTDYADTSDLLLVNLDESDGGYFYCSMINSDFSELTLYTDSIKVVINGPIDIALSNSSVDENSISGTAIGTLMAEDPDQTGGHSFSLTEGDGINDADNTQFSIDGITLTIQTSPDYETKQEYKINVRATDEDMKTLDKAFVIVVNDINEPDALTDAENAGYYLGQNYPNPFRETTTIEFQLPVDDQVYIEFFDMRGRVINTYSGFYSAGIHFLEINLKGKVESGVYLFRMKTSGYTNSRMCMVR